MSLFPVYLCLAAFALTATIYYFVPPPEAADG